jgi:mRNA interferase RelE/StbE
VLDRLDARDPRTAERVLAALTRYALTGQGDVQPLRGRPESRLRVGGWRVVFELDASQHVIYVLAVALRKDVYRR